MMGAFSVSHHPKKHLHRQLNTVGRDGFSANAAFACLSERTVLENWPRIKNIWRGNYIPKVKAASKLIGVDAGAVRAPLMPLSAAEEKQIAICLEPLN